MRMRTSSFSEYSKLRESLRQEQKRRIFFKDIQENPEEGNSYNAPIEGAHRES